MNSPGCNGFLFKYGACPSERGAAGTTPQEVKQSAIGAAGILLGAIPIFDFMDAFAGAAEDSAIGDAAAACRGMSFTSDTKVLLASGLAVPIASLKPGDKVLATNTRTGKTQAEPVTAVLVHHDTNRYNLTIKPAPHRTAVIHTTTTHLFWNQPTRHWVKAGALRHGSYLRTPGGAAVTVLGGYTPVKQSGWMWDLTVTTDHDFYVEANGGAVLAHNCPLYEPSGGVYTLRDPETGAVVRTGRARILAERAVTHARTPELSQFRFQVEYRTSDFNTQVGLEQMLYERYPEAQVANGGFNIRAPVDARNPMYNTYMQAAQDYLAALEGG